MGLDAITELADRVDFRQLVFFNGSAFKTVVYLPEAIGIKENALKKSKTIKEIKKIGHDETSAVYVATIQPTTPFPPQFHELNAYLRGPIQFEKEKGLTFRFLAGQDSVVDILNYFRTNKIKFKIKKASDWKGFKDRKNGVELTNRQKRLFQYALQNGYFKIPRRISTKKIAKYFSISTVAALEHLRKAQRKILTAYFKNRTDTPTEG